MTDTFLNIGWQTTQTPVYFIPLCANVALTVREGTGKDHGLELLSFQNVVGCIEHVEQRQHGAPGIGNDVITMFEIDSTTFLFAQMVDECWQFDRGIVQRI